MRDLPPRSRYRLLAALGTVGLLLAAFLVAAEATRVVPEVPPSGTTILERGEEAMTEWVEVRAGDQVSWTWSSSRPLLNFLVEATGHGILAGGDQYGDRGCVRSDSSFALRIWWGHNNLAGRDVPATLTYTIAVEEASLSCPSVEQVLEARRFVSLSQSVPPVSVLLVGSAVVFGALGAACLIRAMRLRAQIMKHEQAVERRLDRPSR